MHHDDANNHSPFDPDDDLEGDVNPPRRRYEVRFTSAGVRLPSPVRSDRLTFPLMGSEPS
jgi:hypothetical protein